VIAVNGINPMNLIQEYIATIAQTVYNTTLKLLLQVSFTSYFTVQNGIKDSLTYTASNNSIKLVTIKRYKEDSIKNRNPRPTKE
jgi:hypothetical protein